MIEAGGIVKGLNAGAREVPRSALDGLIGRAQELGAKGLVWAFREGEGWRSPTAKFLSAEELAALNERLEAEEGDLLLVVADKPDVANAVLAQLRLDLGRALRADRPRRRRSSAGSTEWPMFELERGRAALGSAAPPVHGPGGRVRPRDPGDGDGARLRRRLERPGARRRLDPHLRPGAPAARRWRRSGSTARRPRSASASCSRRCATARRRTAGSPTGSTGSSSGSSTPTRSAT